MGKGELFSEILGILDICLGLADTDHPRIRTIMHDLFDGRATEDAVSLLRGMAQQQYEYASEGVEQAECLVLAHRLSLLADKLERVSR